MFSAKVHNGFNMARMGRFDLEHSQEDDRLIVYVRLDDGSTVRVYCWPDGTTSNESVTRSAFDDLPADGHSTQEVTVGF